MQERMVQTVSKLEGWGLREGPSHLQPEQTPGLAWVPRAPSFSPHSTSVGTNSLPFSALRSSKEGGLNKGRSRCHEFSNQ